VLDIGVLESSQQAKQGPSGLCIEDLMAGEFSVSAEDLGFTGTPVAHPAGSCSVAVSPF